jgi:histidyl-tRNA synthetase
MKASLPKGVRDFIPEEVDKRNFIFDTIKSIFIKYGYRPIETPVMESLSTLTGKYGEEGDRLLFKVLNNGDFLSKAKPSDLEAKNSNAVLPMISKRGLRFDLTVPFARFVAQHQNDIAFPFKRYQIQPVWRGDRPQKGRYQEFYQCDVDVVGSDSLMYEAELVQIYDEVFATLGVRTEIRVSNRKVLAGMAEVAGIADQFMDMTIAIDKLDKIGEQGVMNEMRKKDISEISIATVLDILKVTTLDELAERFQDSEIGMKGIEELREMHSYLDLQSTTNDVKFDITLARGLNYYTGCIFEVVAKDAVMGSIGGGGRYDDLTSVFGLKNVSGVGVSFGAERIYDVMTELDLFPKENAAGLKILLLTFDNDGHKYAFGCLNQLRAAGINSDLYPTPTKMKKQMKYANAIKVPYIIVIGGDEIKSGNLGLKNMETGQQDFLSLNEIIDKLG